MRRILVIEDDPQMLLGLKDNLEHEGFETLTAKDGEAGICTTILERPDLVILDVMLPKVSGFQVCRSLRQRGYSAPILMLTARGQEEEKVRGLELGADDYVTKPFSINELLARIKALLRRADYRNKPLQARYRSGELRVDFTTQQTWLAGRELPLTSLEFELMRYLIAKRGDVVSRQELLRDVWGYSRSTATRTVDNVMAHLRKKLGGSENRSHILTVHGVGYKFVD